LFGDHHCVSVHAMQLDQKDISSWSAYSHFVPFTLIHLLAIQFETKIWIQSQSCVLDILSLITRMLNLISDFELHRTLTSVTRLSQHNRFRILFQCRRCSECSYFNLG